MDEARVKLIWKAHMALILLYAEKNHDISFVSNPLLDLVENAARQSDSMNSMRIFIEGFQDLVDCTNNLELGQYMFIGKLYKVITFFNFDNMNISLIFVHVVKSKCP